MLCECGKEVTLKDFESTHMVLPARGDLPPIYHTCYLSYIECGCGKAWLKDPNNDSFRPKLYEEGQRYTRKLFYKKVFSYSGKESIIYEDENGIEYRWETSKNSKALLGFKSGWQEVSFRVSYEFFDRVSISHLKYVKK